MTDLTLFLDFKRRAILKIQDLENDVSDLKEQLASNSKTRQASAQKEVERPRSRAQRLQSAALKRPIILKNFDGKPFAKL